MTALRVAFLLVLVGCGPASEVDVPPSPSPDVSSTATPVSPEPTEGVDLDGDGVFTPQDCDDLDATVYPGAEELCDGKDNDCDGEQANELLQTWYRDVDLDGYGNTSVTTVDCQHPRGYVLEPGDCDDTNPAVHPGAAEVCDGVDTDCDPLTLEPVGDQGTAAYYHDADGDGFGDPATLTFLCGPGPDDVRDGTDCDDADPLVFPGAAERCNGRDDDCDLTTPELQIFWIDADRDGSGGVSARAACTQPDGTATATGDCDDTDPTVGLDAPEQCDGVDNDCDGLVDDGLARYFVDQDGDGFGLETDIRCEPASGYASSRGDCRDDDPHFYPGAGDAGSDGIDQDCGGTDGPDPHVGLGTASADSIRAAIDAASTGATVWVGPGTWLEHDLTFSGKTLQLRSTGLAAATVISAGGLGRAFTFAGGEGPQAVVDGFTLRDGLAERGGGIALFGSSPTLRRLAIVNNTARVAGGGLYAEDADVNLSDSDVSENSARNCVTEATSWEENTTCDPASGGGMHVERGQLTLRGIRVYANDTAGDGGGISIRDAGPSSVSFTSIEYNYASRVCDRSRDLTGYNCFTEQCERAGAGGGIFSRSTPLELASSLLRKNSTQGAGGGMHIEGSSPVIEGSFFVGNGAEQAIEESFCDAPMGYVTYSYEKLEDGRGGAVFAADGDTLVRATSLTSGYAYGAGAGVYAEGGTLTLDRASATFGSALPVCVSWPYYCSSGQSSYYVRTCGPAYGGGLYLSGATAVLRSSLLARNRASSGGGLFADASSTTLESVLVAANLADQVLLTHESYCSSPSSYTYDERAGTGGGLALQAGEADVYNSRLVQNAARTGAGEFRWATGSEDYQQFSIDTLESRGGALDAGLSGVRVRNSVLAENDASWGAGLYLAGGSLELSQTTVSGGLSSPICDVTVNGYEGSSLCGGGEGGGLYLSGAGVQVHNAILAGNIAVDLFRLEDGASSPIDVRWSDLWDDDGLPTHNLEGLDTSNLAVAPGFLAYEGERPIDYHLAMGSALIDAGDPAGLDPDGARADPGAYGGIDGDRTDLDGDGFPDWFWPGTIDDAPAGFDPADWDCDDADPSAACSQNAALTWSVEQRIQLKPERQRTSAKTVAKP